VLCATPTRIYFNGVDVGACAGSWSGTNTLPLFLFGLNAAGSFSGGTAGTIAAAAIWDGTPPTAAQVAAVSAAMAAL
jgi:hypothetical protein